jgi:DNA replication ATP-dependent helicase Dna2
MREMRSVEVLTADKSQGRDKDCIIISMVRSNELGNVSMHSNSNFYLHAAYKTHHHLQIGDLLRDWRRINVSFTRAKKKLVIFGSRSTLEKDRLLADFLDLMDSRGWLYKLPPSAHEQFAAVFPLLSQSAPSPPVQRERKPKQERLGKDVMASRPFLRDALNVRPQHLDWRPAWADF